MWLAELALMFGVLFHTNWERCMSWACKGGRNGWCHPEYLASFNTWALSLLAFLREHFQQHSFQECKLLVCVLWAQGRHLTAPLCLWMEEQSPCLCLRPWDRSHCVCWTTACIQNLLSSTPPDQAAWWSHTWILASLLNSAMWQRASQFSFPLAIAPEWPKLQGLSFFNFFFSKKRASFWWCLWNIVRFSHYYYGNTVQIFCLFPNLQGHLDTSGMWDCSLE